MIQITTCDTVPYGDALEECLGECFCLDPLDGQGKSTVDKILGEIAGRGQCRAGCALDSYTMQSIAEIIARQVAVGNPIPMLCPWGSRKPFHTGVDVADLGGLRMIECLDERVKAHYSPGIAVNMRIEDVGGHYLFADTGEAGREASRTYVDGLLDLTKVLGIGCLRVIPESNLMTEADHSALARDCQDVLEIYIHETDSVGVENRNSLKSWDDACALGWQGEIPFAQREYYRSRYRRLYPGRTEGEYTRRLAGYFASSLARYKLYASGASSEWGNDFLTLNFCPPVPGIPFSMNSRTVYFRTFPEKMAKTHIPPWRARGYFKIQDGYPHMKIASPTEPLSLCPCTMMMERDGVRVQIQTPYITA
jgi:hypothetical protein